MAITVSFSERRSTVFDLIICHWLTEKEGWDIEPTSIGEYFKEDMKETPVLGGNHILFSYKPFISQNGLSTEFWKISAHDDKQRLIATVTRK